VLISDTPALVAALADVGHVDTDALVEARLQVHWAQQVLASVGFSYMPPADDYSHAALRWRPDAGALLTDVLPGSGLAGALVPASLTLQVRQDRLCEGFELVGQTLDEAYAWMRHMVVRHTGRSPKGGRMHRPTHDLAAHPVGDGAPFGGASVPALDELSRWLSAAYQVVSAVAEDRDDASAPRVWPHHFDLATLITLAGSGENARTVGVGLSPGDGSHPQPYFYVTPWPYPEGGADLPALPGGGQWHTEGWTGAVLTRETVCATEAADARAATVTEFVDAAIEAAIALIRS
jgi:hypothetical protein